MKKIIYTVAGIMLTATLMVGCSTKASAGDTQSTDSTKSASTDDGSVKQKNMQKSDLGGEVASIDGNKITLKLIKAPEKPADGAQKNTGKDASKDVTADKKDSQAKAPEKRQVEYTGETKDITIGDEVKITTMTRGQQDAKPADLKLSDIKVGDVLQVTYSDKEKETVSNINVRPAAKPADNK